MGIAKQHETVPLTLANYHPIQTVKLTPENSEHKTVLPQLIVTQTKPPHAVRSPNTLILSQLREKYVSNYDILHSYGAKPHALTYTTETTYSLRFPPQNELLTVIPATTIEHRSTTPPCHTAPTALQTLPNTPDIPTYVSEPPPLRVFTRQAPVQPTFQTRFTHNRSTSVNHS